MLFFTLDHHHWGCQVRPQVQASLEVHGTEDDVDEAPDVMCTIGSPIFHHHYFFPTLFLLFHDKTRELCPMFAFKQQRKKIRKKEKYTHG